MLARSGALGAGLLALLAAGCTVNGPDAASPSEEPPSETRSPRPAELPLEGKTGADLCSLLSPEQQGRLGIEDGRPTAQQDPGDPPGCVWTESSHLRYTMGVRALPEEMAEAAGEESSATAKYLSIAGGFPARQRQIPGAESLGCTVFVGVAEKWTLAANIANPPEGMTDQQMCGQARESAELAVTTLQGPS